MSNPFEVLGLSPSFSIDKDTLDQAYRRVMMVLHPDRYPQATKSEQFLIKQRAGAANDAYLLLKCPLKRAEALLLSLNGPLESTALPDASFLMWIMEQQERLDEGDSLKMLLEEGEKALSSWYEDVEKGFERNEIGFLKTKLPEYKYLKRLLEQLQSQME